MLANDTEYGLAAYFYTRDLRRAWHIAEQLEYGMVGLRRVCGALVTALQSANLHQPAWQCCAKQLGHSMTGVLCACCMGVLL